MPVVTLGIGSNTAAVENISSCLDALLLRFGDMKLSSVFRSAAEGSEGPPYLNMAVAFTTELALEELAAFLKKLEDKQGRRRDDPAKREVALDVDILTYGNRSGSFGGVTLPRPGLESLAYVLWPLSQVAPRERHAVLQENFATLWKSFAGDKSSLHAVDFEWHGRKLSSGAPPSGSK